VEAKAVGAVVKAQAEAATSVEGARAVEAAAEAKAAAAAAETVSAAAAPARLDSQPAPADGSIELASKLHAELLNLLDKPPAAAVAVLALLHRIRQAHCSRETLSVTQIGRTVNKHPVLKQHTDTRVRQAAKDLISDWKSALTAGATAAPVPGGTQAKIAELERAVKLRDRQLADRDRLQRQHALRALQMQRFQQQLQTQAVLQQEVAQAATASTAAGNAGVELECTVCMANARSTLLVPCRHIVTCADCIPMLNGACPICRCAIEGTHHVFL